MPVLRRPDGVDLAWGEQGEGPLIVLANQFFGRAETFDGLIRDLTRDHRLVTYNLRGTGESTRDGPYDMETDAALLLVLSVLALRLDKAGAWVLLIGLMRYLFVATGWLLPWLTAPLTATVRGKTVAVVQMVTLAIALVLPRPLASAATATALALLIWSFAIDVGRLWGNRDS